MSEGMIGNIRVYRRGIRSESFEGLICVSGRDLQ